MVSHLEMSKKEGDLFQPTPSSILVRAFRLLYNIQSFILRRPHLSSVMALDLHQKSSGDTCFPLGLRQLAFIGGSSVCLSVSVRPRPRPSVRPSKVSMAKGVSP